MALITLQCYPGLTGFWTSQTLGLFVFFFFKVNLLEKFLVLPKGLQTFYFFKLNFKEKS